MPSIKSYKKQVVKEVDEFLSNGFDKVNTIHKDLEDAFKHKQPSELTSMFEQELASVGYDKSNSLVDKIYNRTRDLLREGIDLIMLLERYISLHIPAMEDGNNFGVSVQMVVSKSLKEIKEAWMKKLETLPTYFSARADAVDKLGLGKTVHTQTQSSSELSSAGGKDGDEKKNSASSSKEEKTTSSKPDELRIKHLIAIDVQWYIDLRLTLASLMNGYITIIDNMDKNKGKLTAPKGSGGSGINMGMY